jgi:4,4'-diaponeurosporenoate glycosyltransferase
VIVISLLLILLKWVLGFLLFWRLPLCGGASLPRAAAPGLSLIIPARNEEANLPLLLETIRSQDLQPGEVIVVDDDSRDRTPAVAEHGGATVISQETLPEGWTGKSRACWEGAKAARGPLLLFLDADTRLEPGALEKMTGEYARRGGTGLFSLYPYHFMERAYERLSAFFNVISTMSLGIAAAFRLGRKPMGAFGACILCRRDEYLRSGGHKAVRGEILDDVALAQRFHQEGYAVHCLGGRKTIRFRMYPQGLKQMAEGWSKNFASGAKASNPLLVFMVFAWIFGLFEVLFLAFVAPLTAQSVPWAGAILLYGLCVFQIHLMLVRIGNFGLATALFFPIPLLVFLVIFIYSLFLTFVVRRVTWRGRSIRLARNG